MRSKKNYSKKRKSRIRGGNENIRVAQGRIARWITLGDVNAILDLKYLKLTELPVLPPTLTQLDCSDNKLTKLPELPPTLRVLNCDRNKLAELPALPPTLTELFCGFNLLSKLPELPDGLISLRCDYNKLAVLPALPPTLTELFCGYNRLSKLPELPPTLRVLNCDSNKLTKLPELPHALQELYCYGNSLYELPELPDGLRKLYCYDNSLYELPELPGTLRELEANGNLFSDRLGRESILAYTYRIKKEQVESENRAVTRGFLHRYKLQEEVFSPNRVLGKMKKGQTLQQIFGVPNDESFVPPTTRTWKINNNKKRYTRKKIFKSNLPVIIEGRSYV